MSSVQLLLLLTTARYAHPIHKSWLLNDMSKSQSEEEHRTFYWDRLTPHHARLRHLSEMRSMLISLDIGIPHRERSERL